MDRSDDSFDLDEFFAHHGVKGMRWGVRKDDPNGVHRLQASTAIIDPSLTPETRRAGVEVSSLIKDRYKFNITAVKAMSNDDPEYQRGTIAYVRSTPGTRDGVINMSPFDLGPVLKEGEASGWFGAGCGDVRSLMTHESAHAIFHADQNVTQGLFGEKISSSTIKARDKAIDAALEAAGHDGVRDTSEFLRRISDYASTAGVREEAEAEMFAQYHWGKNPERFVKVWGETLHKELGIDGTPFKEAVKRG